MIVDIEEQARLADNYSKLMKFLEINKWTLENLQYVLNYHYYLMGFEDGKTDQANQKKDIMQ